MKKIFGILLISFTIFSCIPQNQAASEQNKEIKPEKNNDGEWDLQVIDSQYDYFLNAIAKPMSFYTESYLKSRNASLVSEWNSLYFSGRYKNVIESSIDYNPQENYGLKFEYKLYQVFAYVQWKYGLKLNGFSQ
ncbi:DUF6146 family protein [Halpernia sp.]|uniref:DUF6146 family protein n=1 Tax=Halpernia sp. TaxID=2782209 RepID=UPI003A938B56